MGTEAESEQMLAITLVCYLRSIIVNVTPVVKAAYSEYADKCDWKSYSSNIKSTLQQPDSGVSKKAASRDLIGVCVRHHCVTWRITAKQFVAVDDATGEMVSATDYGLILTFIYRSVRYCCIQKAQRFHRQAERAP
jgi:hypothetical protein